MPHHLSDVALAESHRLGVRAVDTLRPLSWLVRGWHDLKRCPWPGLLHGMALALFGGLLMAVAHREFWMLAGAFSGFLLVGPVLATGLYAISRDLERDAPVGLETALAAWHPRDSRLVVFGLLLALAGTGWVLTSAALITRFAPVPIHNPLEFLRHVVLAEDGWLFEGWLALGAVMAAPVYASSVVAMPLLLDRRIGVFGAVLTSWRVVLENPVPMALWAVLLVALTLLGMMPLLVGMIVVAPWLSHASWHAYRDLVEPSGWTEAR